MASTRHSYAERINPPADPLSGLAPLLRVRPQLQEVCRFAEAWRAPHEAGELGWAQFHIVTRGACRVELEGESLRLAEGDVLLLPQGDAHVVRSLRARGEPVPIRIEPGEPLKLKTNTDGAGDTELICGQLRFEAAPAALILAALPRALRLKPGSRPALERLRLLVDMIREEIDAAGAGAEAVAGDLASALFVMLLRLHLQRAAASGEVFRLLAEPAAARAVEAMVKDPARAWSLDELAALAYVSRASLVRAFRKAAGIAPLAFLAELRLGLARQRLAAAREPLIQVALAVGYDSESAFVRAFRRRFGMPPGKAREALRQAEA